MKLEYFNDSNIPQMLRVYVGTVKTLENNGLKKTLIANITRTRPEDVDWATKQSKLTPKNQDQKFVNKNVTFYQKAIKSEE